MFTKKPELKAVHGLAGKRAKDSPPEKKHHG
jgi:hypothetical protein